METTAARRIDSDPHFSLADELFQSKWDRSATAGASDSVSEVCYDAHHDCASRTVKHKSIEDWALDAYDYVQHACNLSGIVFAFEECIQDLAAEAKQLKQSDLWIDEHHVSVVWADKLDDLSGSRRLPSISCGEHLSDVILRFAAPIVTPPGF